MRGKKWPSRHEDGFLYFQLKKVGLSDWTGKTVSDLGMRCFPRMIKRFCCSRMKAGNLKFTNTTAWEWIQGNKSPKAVQPSGLTRFLLRTDRRLPFPISTSICGY